MTADDPPASGLQDLYVRCAPAALRLAYILSGDREMARDLVRDAFVRVAGRFRHLHQPDEFDAYLRRHDREPARLEAATAQGERSSLAREAALPVPGSVEADQGVRDEMWHAILGLSPRQRAAIVLRYYEDLSERQAAEVLRTCTRPGR